MAKKAPQRDFQKLFRAVFWKTLLLPVMLLIFFAAAPAWYSSQLHSEFRQQIAKSQEIPDADKADRIAFFDKLNLENFCFHPPAGLQDLHDDFEKNDICGTFGLLWWAWLFSVVLVAVLGVTMLSIWCLNLGAKKSPESLLRNYRLGWRIAMSAALIKLVLLIPLLAYGTFEFTVLLMNEYFIKLLFVIVVGGAVAFWASLKVLFKKVPLEFHEGMSREITPEDAPEMWGAIRRAADVVQATPPDRVIVGVQLNFFVTELAVTTDTTRVTGRTLFLSYPLLKQLSPDEVLAIIGHELGHFKGDDTRMTREFYPLRLKVNETIANLANAGWVAMPSSGVLAFFNLMFEKAIQEHSRRREFLADQVGASLATPQTTARALVKFSVLAEAFGRMLRQSDSSQTQNPMAISWRSFISEKILPADPFWTMLAEEKVPHPLDSHPPLQDRLEALGNLVQVAEARQISLQESENAYEAWFAGRDGLFADLGQKVEKAVGEIRERARFATADYQTEEGKVLLEQHFPEVRWRKKGAAHFAGLFLYGTLALVSLVLLFLIPGFLPKLFLLGFVALFVWISTIVWKSRNDVIVLTAEGVSASQWKRALQFSEVEAVELSRINSVLQVNFKFKKKQPSPAKWTLGNSVKSVVLMVKTGWSEKPDTMALTIYRYFTRQPLN
jgi:Zn-dependent protease with chaperone function